jgi:hypothetical protein
VGSGLLEVKEAARLQRQALDELATAMGNFRMEIQSLSGSLPETLQIASIKAAVFAGDHPAVAVTQSEVEAQRARVKQARAERVPDVNLDLVYRRIESSRLDTFDVGVRIPIPLFDRNKRSARPSTNFVPQRPGSNGSGIRSATINTDWSSPSNPPSKLPNFCKTKSCPKRTSCSPEPRPDTKRATSRSPNF